MSKQRILFLVYDGFELLDMAGPATVFTTANALDGRRLYEVMTVSTSNSVVSSGGIVVATTPFGGLRLSARDTVLVMGAYAGPLERANADADIARVLRRAAHRAERFGSVCTGAFLLATAGLLGGKRATTHWAGCEQFRTLFTDVILEAESLYVNDGRLWTSAGVTTGVDMALAMLAQDHGPALMGRVAKTLVVYAHRPGHQSQFSGIIDAQTKQDGEFASLISWLGDRLDRRVTIAAMAAHVGMSERSLLRRFSAAIGVTPAQCLEALRLDRARLALEAGEPVKLVAARVGFRSEAAFRSLFTKRIGVTPSHYAKMHLSPWIGARGPSRIRTPQSCDWRGHSKPSGPGAAPAEPRDRQNRSPATFAAGPPRRRLPTL